MTQEKQETLFDEVLVAYYEAGKEMDNWTKDKFTNLRKQFNVKGSLTSAQESLLASLTKYIPKSPAMNSGKQGKSAPVAERTPLASLVTPESRFSNYNDPMFEWVLDFKAKMRTSWIPTKDDIFQYGYFMRRLGLQYSPPNRWAKEFEEYNNDPTNQRREDK